MGREAKKAKAKQSRAKQAASSKKKAGRGSSGTGIDVHAVRAQLATRGYQLVTIESDGNCLFRALSDQLHGDQSHFAAVRQRIVAHIKTHQDELEPFMEDEEKFDHYCKRMADDGVWGGNLELFVAAQVWQHHIVVHQVDGNCTTIDCGDAQAETFHVCYYNDEHYDSIRSIDDDLTGAPTQIRHDTAGSGKICVEMNQDNAPNTTSAKDTASRGIERVPHTPELQLVQLWAKLNCDENRVRRKLAKRIVKTNKRK